MPEFKPELLGIDMPSPGSDRAIVSMEIEAFRAMCARIAELEAERAELEEALEFVAADHQDKSARELARKLLEKGNE